MSSPSEQTSPRTVSAHRWMAVLLGLFLPVIAVTLTHCKADEASRGSLANPGPSTTATSGGKGDGAPDCSHDGPGCACALEGQHLVCGKVVEKIEHTTLCGQGISVCHEGVWSDCVLSNAAPIPVEDAPSGYYSTQGLGGGTTCPNNPCDPYCMQYPDVPDPTLTDPADNLKATDAGLEPFPDAAAGPCTPKTCAQLGKNCGPMATGCGTTVNCGTCTAPLTCGGSGVPSVCGKVATQACTPKTCAQLGKNCGPVGDGCGGVLNCGTCTAPSTCGGAGTPSVCGVPTPPGGFCVPKTCANQGKNCGPVSDTCGGLLQCGNCTAPSVCGGGGTASVCGVPTPPGGFCTPKTCAQLGKNCGPVADGCGGLLDCGTCQSPASCGGGGVASKCGTSALCTGLCLQQQICGPGVSTTITGTVYAPNGTEPLPNVIVYVPNAPVPAFTQGITCDNCATVQGSPLVYAKTATDGTFTITNMPSGSNIPLVIQIGRWRRQVTIPSVPSCTTTALPSSLTRLPKNKGEGDIPKIALVSGCVDGMECVLRKMGIDTAEFTSPSTTGRVHFYYGGYCGGAYLGSGYSTGTNAGYTWREDNLLNVPSRLDDYDMVLYPCQANYYYWGGGYQKLFQDNLAAYVNGGGRLFATHYNFGYLYNDGNIFQSSLSGAFNWDLDSPAPANQTGYINTTFARGSQLANWLKLPAVNASSTLGQIGLNTIRNDYASVNAGTLNWLSLADGRQVHATFDTPRSVPAANQCGRVVFSDFHVVDASTQNQAFPNYCSNAAMTPQEKLLEYMIFDLSSCVGDITPPVPPCTPTTCAAQGITCGQAGNGCGGTLTCGGACPTPTCTPTTCAAQGLQCGPAGNGCGGTLNCGTCTAPQTCGGGGISGQCGSPPVCAPISCASQGLSCGQAGDGCGGTLNCGTCTAPQTCGGGGIPGTCGAPPVCSPIACPSPGVICGQTGDGCGGTLNCGCTAPNTCGGGGVPGKCGSQPACVPTTCAAQSLTCGPAGDGCGGTLNCGTCTLPQTCGGGNVPGQCGALTVYDHAYFDREYEASCGDGTTPYWQIWSWTSLTASDSSIDFTVQTAATKAGLDAAPADALLFSDPPGPLALLDQPTKAHRAGVPAGTPDTQSGSALVDYTLKKAGRLRNQRWLRIRSHLAPSADKSSNARLTSWNLQVDCIPTE